MATYKKYIILAIIMLVSGLYCLLFFNGYLGLSDGNDYAGLARSIIRGEGFSLGHLYPLALTFDSDIPQPDNLWAPAYPVYLALWFKLFGMGDATILAAIIFSIWLFIIAVYYLTEKVAGANWALLGAGLIGLSQSVLSTALEGSPEPLTAALLLLSLYPLLSGKSIFKIVISAILFGITVLSRYQMAALAIPVILFLIERRLKTIILWSAVVAIVISPWLIRNYIVLGNPFFTLQSYGEFTKSMGHLKYYYYTYRSFTPMSFGYAISHFPLYVAKKFAAGIIFFSWWTVSALNFFAAIPFAVAVLRRISFDSSQRKFINFGFASLILLVAISSLDGIHLRHLINILGVLIIVSILGLKYLSDRFRIFGNSYIRTGAVILLLLPLRFPFIEAELMKNASRIEENKKVYSLIANTTEPDAVIVSDASDAVWWYGDRLSIWIPVVYDDFVILLETHKVDYIYFENGSEYLESLDENQLLDFFSIASIVDGTPFGWSLYKIER